MTEPGTATGTISEDELRVLTKALGQYADRRSDEASRWWNEPTLRSLSRKSWADARLAKNLAAALPHLGLPAQADTAAAVIRIGVDRDNERVHRRRAEAEVVRLRSELAEARSERDRLSNQLAAVEKLHQPALHPSAVDPSWTECVHCRRFYPCPTLTAARSVDTPSSLPPAQETP